MAHCRIDSDSTLSDYIPLFPRPYTRELGRLPAFQQFNQSELAMVSPVAFCIQSYIFFIAGVIVNRKKLFAAPPKGKKLYLAVNTLAWLPITVHMFLRIWPFLTENFSVTPLYRILWFASFHISSIVMVYLMVESFRRYFNKTGKFWNALNRNSFGVYIIHVIVLGFLGTLLLYVNLPAVAKWILLVISTYSVSNLIVAIYVFIQKITFGIKTVKTQEVSL